MDRKLVAIFAMFPIASLHSVAVLAAWVPPAVDHADGELSRDLEVRTNALRRELLAGDGAGGLRARRASRPRPRIGVSSQRRRVWIGREYDRWRRVLGRPPDGC